MIDRGVEIAGFLAHHAWDDAQQMPFEADFSPRRYARLTKTDGTQAILMDANPDQKTPQFVALARTLQAVGLSSPLILAADPRRGLVLLEDFGDQNFGALIDAGADAKPFLLRAVDVLVHLHKNFTQALVQDIDIPTFDAALFADQATLFLDACFAMRADREATPEEREAFHAAWCQVLACLKVLPTSLLLRDFMPDNLMDLPDRRGVASVGLLDFQDAGLGSVAYDLASLVEVVRRDGMEAFCDDVLAYYHEHMRPSYSLQSLTTACVALSAQRHTRILGIVVRLALAGRAEKLAYIPRIQAHLMRMLEHPVLTPVADWFHRYSPLESSP